MIKKNLSILSIIFILFSCKSTERNLGYINSNDGVFSDSSIMERPLPDSRGVITYKDYQIIVANGKETVEELANRLGVEPNRLSSYNGVLLTYLPRKDEILALPFKLAGGVDQITSGWSQERAAEAIANSVQNKGPKVGTPDNPIRHRIQPGETAYAIARLYNVSVTSLAKWNGLDTDLSLTAGRELIIPVSSNFNRKPTTQKEVESAIPDTNISEKAEKKSNETKATQPADNQATEDTQTNDRNNDKDSLAEATPEKPYVKPVEGRILRNYNPTATSNKNEGVDFYAPPGTPVKATAKGVIALVSKPVGGSGKIVLIKHELSVISIYGRVKDLLISKGDRVLQGQVIGYVEKSALDVKSTGQENYLHFELRKGTKSLDPIPLLR